MDRDEAFLRHILEEVRFLRERYSPLELNEVVGDEVLKRACIRSLEVIGEAVKKLSDGFKERHGERIKGSIRDTVIFFFVYFYIPNFFLIFSFDISHFICLVSS